MRSKLAKSLGTAVLVGGSLLAAPTAASAAPAEGVQALAAPSNCQVSSSSTSYSMKCRSHINIGSYYVDGYCGQTYVQGAVRTDGVWPFWGKPSKVSCSGGTTLTSPAWHYFD
jgi:hypothetical protein